MTKLIWGAVGERFYEAGTDRGVLYLNGKGIPWDGLISVQESPSGGDPTAYYIDGVKYLDHSNPEEFQATIEAYTYPDEFVLCDGSMALANGLAITQQRRKSFGLAYRTKIGNDLDGIDHGYKLHVVYNAMVTPTTRDYKTLGEEIDPLTFSWKISTTPMKFDDPAFGTMYGSHLVIDSRVTYPWAMQAVENVLFGSETTDATLPNPTDLLKLFVDNALLKIFDNGDGTWTADGPAEAMSVFNVTNGALVEDPADAGVFNIQNGSISEDSTDAGTFTLAPGLIPDALDMGTFQTESIEEFTLSWPSVTSVDEDTFTASSL